MFNSDLDRGRQSRLPRLTMAAISLLAFLLSPSLLLGKSKIPNLGGGLEELANAASQTRSLLPSQRAASLSSAAGIELHSPMIMDASGRPLVRITLDGSVQMDSMVNSLRSMNGVSVTTMDAGYRAGVIEAFVPASLLKRCATADGVLAIVPASPAVTNAGDVVSQGVVQHRVDKIKGVDGSGITIGVLSDSYNVRVPTLTTAEDDVATGDLPGAGNPFGRNQEVVVLEDIPSGSDEGRAMMQLIHDMAPGARLGFATAFGGEVGFANNIRALAGFEDAPNAVPGFAADVIVDDIIYLAEPFFQDGIIAQAVDDVADAGVAYFSSAGNRPATQGYDSEIRIVTGDPTLLTKTPLDFSGVDPALYAGGFHDFDPTDGVDIAQTVNINDGTFVLQWNELFDPVPPTPIQLIVEGVGTVPAGGFDVFTFDGSAGVVTEVFLDADDSTTGVPNPDLTFTLVSPSGVPTFIDTGTNPESLIQELTETGTYTVFVEGFQGVGGDFLYRVTEVEVVEQVLSDYVVHLFLSGSYLGYASEQNLFTNRPIELLGLNTGGATIPFELVISRANTPTSKDAADRLRYVFFGSGENGPQEYFSYLGPVTYGHNSAAGAMGVAAYAFFPPFIPESFTSPGPSTIYFTRDGRRLKRPEIRKKPDMAAMDGANNTFFGNDASQDEDDFPNFFGTSAAAPHAAAIAALVMEAAGGPGSLKPGQVRRILQRSAFEHDLDPYYSSGADWKRGNFVAVSAVADANSISQFDPNVFKVLNIGRRPLGSISLNGEGGNPTQTPTGIVFDERVGPGQPFVIGESRGIDAADVTASFSIPAAPPGVDGQWQQIDLEFASGKGNRYQYLSFGVDRDEADAAGPNGAVSGNSADLLGDGVGIPDGKRQRSGIEFFGTFGDGRGFSGRFRNAIGKGYSQLDGYGFINAERAVRMVRRYRDDDDRYSDDDDD